MIKDFIRGKEGFFALDIGSTAIRVLEVGSSKGAVKLSKYGFSVIDSNLSDITNATSRQYLSEIIKSTIRESGIKSRNVVMAPPSSFVIQKVVEIKRQSDLELEKIFREQFMKREAKDGKMNFDYHVIGPSPSSDGKDSILLTAVSRKIINEQSKMLKSIGLSLVAVEPESIAVTRAILAKDQTDFELVVNIKDFATDLFIVSEGVPYLTQTAAFGAGLLVGMLQQNLKIDTITAQKYIADYGLNPEIMNGQIVAAASPAIQHFIDAICRIGNMFSNKYLNNPVVRIVLAGYGASIPRLAETIHDQIGLPVEIADPWRNMSITDKEKAELATVAPHFITTIGLSEREGIL